MPTISILLGLFNVFAGVMVVASFLAFMGGFVRYLVLLGTERRKEGLVLMVWGIVILFVLVVLLAIVNFLQGPLFFILAAAAAIFVCIVIVLSINPSAGPKTDDHQ
jgi:hypothetical protein